MGRKGKRRRRPATAAAPMAGPERAPSAGADVTEAHETGAVETADAIDAPDASDGPDPSSDRPRGLFGRSMGAPSPYPPMGVSLARGIRPVGASPWILGFTFVYLLATWGYYMFAGTEPPSVLLPLLTAVPPVTSILDSSLFRVGEGTVAAFGLALGITVLRAGALTLILPLVVRAVRSEPVTWRAAVEGFLRRFVTLLGLLFAEFGLSLLAFSLVAGFLGQQLALLVVWLIGLQLLGMAVVIPVADGALAADALRRSFRAARLPGSRHFLLVVAYFLMVQILWARAAVGVFVATPTVFDWGFGLFASFLHVGILGTLTYRWLAVRDQVPAGPVRREARGTTP